MHPQSYISKYFQLISDTCTGTHLPLVQNNCRQAHQHNLLLRPVTSIPSRSSSILVNLDGSTISFFTRLSLLHRLLGSLAIHCV